MKEFRDYIPVATILKKIKAIFLNSKKQSRENTTMLQEADLNLLDSESLSQLIERHQSFSAQELRRPLKP